MFDLGFLSGADPGFGKVIWEYYYYCFICLWNVWCRKIKIDLQVIMIIWGEETEPLFSLSVFYLLHLFFNVYLGFLVFFRGGGQRTSPPPPSESASACLHCQVVLFGVCVLKCHVGYCCFNCGLVLCCHWSSLSFIRETCLATQKKACGSWFSDHAGT